MSTSNTAQTPQTNAYDQIRQLLTPFQTCLDIHLFNIDAGLFAAVNLEADNNPMQDLPRGVGILILFGDITANVPPGLTLLD